jgi:hypothetical protein
MAVHALFPIVPALAPFVFLQSARPSLIGQKPREHDNCVGEKRDEPNGNQKSREDDEENQPFKTRPPAVMRPCKNSNDGYNPG